MPNATFFRLPQEKRERLIGAATGEFTRVSFAEASINRIVQGAQIPRGSFYQYFEGKEDLFIYLLGSIREKYFELLEQTLEQEEGNLFAVPLHVFDQLIGDDGSPVPELVPCMRMLKLNQRMDAQSFLGRRPESILPQLLEKVDKSLLRRPDEEFCGNVAHLLHSALICSVMETVWNREQYTQQRAMLAARIDIIQNGSMAVGNLKGEKR